jgi:hypothetical protein
MSTRAGWRLQRTSGLITFTRSSRVKRGPDTRFSTSVFSSNNFPCAPDPRVKAFSIIASTFFANYLKHCFFVFNAEIRLGFTRHFGFIDTAVTCTLHSGSIDTAVTLDLIFERLWLPSKKHIQIVLHYIQLLSHKNLGINKSCDQNRRFGSRLAREFEATSKRL